ncbi:unnamed protein product [Peniophora sp. CBMAI 1063]|nr:unnamed protein product [Peniophora sp. CBMAI 1063]
MMLDNTVTDSLVPPPYAPCEQSSTNPQPTMGDVDDVDIPLINSVEDLREGIVKTRRHRAEEPYTILLVGETGVGKSSLLEYVANVMLGKSVLDYDLDILDRSNEAGGSSKGSQTNSARLYTFESVDGVKIRILDTPGLADTRGIQQDELHKKNIATQIRDYVESVDGVIILANGTLPRLNICTDYALTTLSAIFPKSLAANIGFMFTNVSSPLSWNFSQDSLPAALRDAPQFLFDNPMAHRKKYEEIMATTPPGQTRLIAQLRKKVKVPEEDALETLVRVFDWLDGVTPQPTTEILSLYEKSQAIEEQIANSLAQMEQAIAKWNETQKCIRAIKLGEATMSKSSDYEKKVDTLVWKHVPTKMVNTLCSETGCYSNCHVGCTYDFTLDPQALRRCHAMKWFWAECSYCNHPLEKHSHFRAVWKQVEDVAVEIDREKKEKWDKAKQGKERDEAAQAALEQTLDNLKASIGDSMTKVADLTSEYANLTLSGSFTALIDKAIALYDQKLHAMRASGSVDNEQLQKVEEGLIAMKKKRDFLKVTQAKPEEGIGKSARAWKWIRNQAGHRFQQLNDAVNGTAPSASSIAPPAPGSSMKAPLSQQPAVSRFPAPRLHGFDHDSSVSTPCTCVLLAKLSVFDVNPAKNFSHPVAIYSAIVSVGVLMVFESRGFNLAIKTAWNTGKEHVD